MNENAEATQGRYTVLIMAANRRGINDPVARMGGVSHKCVVPIAGMPMIERVVRTIEAWGKAGRILVSIENSEILDSVPYVADLRRDGRIEFVRSGANFLESVGNAAGRLMDTDYPVLITTGDNVLHTPSIIDDFCTAATASEAEVAFALTPRTVVADSYPQDAPDVGYLTFAEGQHSNCNIYMLRSPRTLPVVRTMQEGGQFRSHPLRILRAFGFVAMVKYQLGRVRIPDIKQRLERLFGLPVAPIILRYAEAPIDVDNPTTYALVERILHQREGTEALESA